MPVRPVKAMLRPAAIFMQHMTKLEIIALEIRPANRFCEESSRKRKFTSGNIWG